jgi:hypothetical protein
VRCYERKGQAAALSAIATANANDASASDGGSSFSDANANDTTASDANTNERLQECADAPANHV